MNLDFLDQDLSHYDGFKILHKFREWISILSNMKSYNGLINTDIDKLVRFEQDNFNKYCKELNIQPENLVSLQITEYGHNLDNHDS